VAFFRVRCHVGGFGRATVAVNRVALADQAIGRGLLTKGVLPRMSAERKTPAWSRQCRRRLGRSAQTRLEI